MAYKYLLNKPGGGGVAGGKALRNTPIFPHLLRRYAYKMIQVGTGESGRR